ncbi:MAG TPA: hypothetical protein VKZ41_13915 [Gemmatimonadales bacterium]|nr:hypothetical protein [Gemmatimonadales bacterium]
MSRSYLYRAVRPRRPLASALLLTAWIGGAALAVFLLLPAPNTAAGDTAAALDRLVPLVAMGAVVSGLLVIGAELAVRARLRVARMVCSGVLVLSGVMASFGASSGERMLHAADGSTVAGGTVAALAPAGSRRADVAWLVVGLVAALGGLGTAVAASRDVGRRV